MKISSPILKFENQSTRISALSRYQPSAFEMQGTSQLKNSSEPKCLSLITENRSEFRKIPAPFSRLRIKDSVSSQR